MRTTLLATAVLAALAGLAAPGSAEAASALALTNDNRLIMFDLDSRSAGGAPMRITGVEGRVVGIDVRPANGMLYAVSDASVIYTLDPATGAATEVARLSQSFPKGVRAVVDFNPVADRLRLMGEDGTNFRINVETGQVMADGQLKHDPAGGQADKPPMVVAGAYTNSMAGAKETALYTVDAALSQVNLQAPPNDGVQKAKGALGFASETTPAFDIVADGAGGNRALLINRGGLYEIDLETGAGTMLGKVSGLTGDVIDMAALPGTM